MEIGVVLIRKDELDESERVFRSRPLPQSHRSGSDTRQICRVRWVPAPILAVATNNLELLSLEVPGVPPDGWYQLGAGDARRYIPVGSKNNLSHDAREHRSLMAVSRPSGNDLHLQERMLRH